MQLRLPSYKQVEGFFTAYESLAGLKNTDHKVEAKKAPKEAKKGPLDECRAENKKQMSEEGRTLAFGLEFLEFLFKKLELDVNTASAPQAQPTENASPSLLSSLGSAIYKTGRKLTVETLSSEESLDKFAKLIAAVRADFARPIYDFLRKNPQLDEKTPIGAFQKKRNADYDKIKKLEEEIDVYKMQIAELVNRKQTADLPLIEKAIAEKQKERKDLIMQYVRWGDMRAVILAAKESFVSYRHVEGLSSKYCPSYLAPGADIYFFSLYHSHFELSVLVAGTFKDYEPYIDKSKPKPPEQPPQNQAGSKDGQPAPAGTDAGQGPKAGVDGNATAGLLTALGATTGNNSTSQAGANHTGADPTVLADSKATGPKQPSVDTLDLDSLEPEALKQLVTKAGATGKLTKTFLKNVVVPGTIADPTGAPPNPAKKATL